MRITGFDPHGYHGTHGQSIEMAVQYYACFAEGAGFEKTVPRENPGSCPNAAQYYGRLVNGVDRMLLIGAQRFSGNKTITGLEADAQKASANLTLPDYGRLARHPGGIANVTAIGVVDSGFPNTKTD